MKSEKGYWFKSSKFQVEPGEDKEINPGIFGRQLAVWLKDQLQKYGYTVEEIINEDWGRCLMCSRDPFMLWVGCGNVTTIGNTKSNDLTKEEDIVWHCFVTAEVFFWKRLFRKIETAPAEEKLYSDLGLILRSEQEITLVDES